MASENLECEPLLLLPEKNDSDSDAANSLPISLQRAQRRAARKAMAFLMLISVALAGIFCFLMLSQFNDTRPEPFYANITNLGNICGDSNSYSGHIGLKGDSSSEPKRSFFWFFEAENDPQNAPIILTIGGGPGSSGLMNPLFGQSPCGLNSDATISFNSNRWTEHFNLIALDHPIGVGYSYGTHVNNSHAAAIDVYDFLQKFFTIFPQFSTNQFVISGGSYGGIYVPNIATIIHQRNLAIADRRAYHHVNRQPHSIHINLESMILSNPLSDPQSHFRWLLHYRCVEKKLYNSTTCEDLYAGLPICLESIQLALQIPTVENRVAATTVCSDMEEKGDLNDTVLEDVRRKCHQDKNDSMNCHPFFGWASQFFNNASTKDMFGVPENVKFSALNMDVNKEFHKFGDLMQSHQLLFEPLLEDGIRLLHYVGAQDGNCAWPGVISNLKLIRSAFQKEFITAPDLPWPSKEDPQSTVRVVGKGAGNMTYMLVNEAGHFVVKDQPGLAKMVVEHWIFNRPFFT